MSVQYICSEKWHAYKEQGHNKSLNADGVKEKINEVNIIQIACGMWLWLENQWHLISKQHPLNVVIDILTA